MKVYTTDLLRNVALVGHQGAGKTSLAESLLFNTGAITRMGKVEERNTVADFDEDEKSRTLSIYTSLLPVEHNGYKINVLDAPGFVDFQGEAKNAVLVSDAAVVVVDAVSGPEVGTELAFDYAQEFGLPVIVVINKMDRENANFNSALNGAARAVPEVPLCAGHAADWLPGRFRGRGRSAGEESLSGRGQRRQSTFPATWLMMSKWPAWN